MGTDVAFGISLGLYNLEHVIEPASSRSLTLCIYVHLIRNLYFVSSI